MDAAVYYEPDLLYYNLIYKHYISSEHLTKNSATVMQSKYNTTSSWNAS